jgi:hypothetical protein
MIVKQAFEHYFNEKSDVKLIRAIIYGTDANAISVAKPKLKHQAALK